MPLEEVRSRHEVLGTVVDDETPKRHCSSFASNPARGIEGGMHQQARLPPFSNGYFSAHAAPFVLRAQLTTRQPPAASSRQLEPRLAAAIDDRRDQENDASTVTVTVGKDVAMSAAPVTPRAGKDSALTLTACARCDRVQLDGRWTNESEVIRLLRSFEHAFPPSFATTICGACRARVERRRATGRTNGDPNRPTAVPRRRVAAA